MIDIVIDSSVALSWCFDDEANAYADAILDRIDELRFCVPIIWRLEIANVLLIAEKRSRIDEARVSAFLHRLSLANVELDTETFAQTWSSTISLGRKYKLSSYDASYVELALRRALPLATLDRQMEAAVKASGLRIFQT